jgi:hypothetical protein
MADTTNNPKQQDQEPRGIGAAAIEGAREAEGERRSPDDAAASLARPAPGMTEQPEPGHSSTNPSTGVTGGLHEDEDADEDANPDRA